MTNESSNIDVKVDVFLCDAEASLLRPLLSGISAGFPSPAADFIDHSIDLNRELIAHPSSTFFGRVKGESMRDAGITDGDLLVIDKSIEPNAGRVAVCFLDGEFTLKRISIIKGEVWLMPANENFSPIHCNAESDFRVWGIVTYVIKKM